MAIKCRGDHVLGGLFTGIDTRHIVMTSKMVYILYFILYFVEARVYFFIGERVCRFSLLRFILIFSG